MAKETDTELVTLLNKLLERHRHPQYIVELADEFKISQLTINRWRIGKNLPHPNIAEPIIKRLEELLTD